MGLYSYTPLEYAIWLARGGGDAFPWGGRSLGPASPLRVRIPSTPASPTSRSPLSLSGPLCPPLSRSRTSLHLFPTPPLVDCRVCVVDARRRLRVCSENRQPLSERDHSSATLPFRLGAPSDGWQRPRIRRRRRQRRRTRDVRSRPPRGGRISRASVLRSRRSS